MTRPNIPAAFLFFFLLLGLCSFTSKTKGPADGDLAPEISLPTTQGDTLKLSSLRGHMVLVHFWASWCQCCRKESRNIVALQNQYKDRHFKTGEGLIVLYVSLDQNKSTWIQAIHEDGLGSGYQVSDPRCWQSPTAQTYKISYVPENFLIDGNGKIVAQGLISHYLPDLIKGELRK